MFLDVVDVVGVVDVVDVVGVIWAYARDGWYRGRSGDGGKLTDDTM